MWLQAGLLLVVLYEKRKVFGPVVLEVPRQVLIHVVLGDRDVEVGVQIARVLWWQNMRKWSDYLFRFK